MSHHYTVRIHQRQTGDEYTFEVPDDSYILRSAEKQGYELPFSCRNGACTSCAVKILSGEIEQTEAIGLSHELREKGYALLCVSYPKSNLEVETQDEDEVYELQFGQYYGKRNVRLGLPIDDD